MRIVKSGSLLFSFKLSVGMVSIAGTDMYTNEAIAAFASSSQVDTQYLYWSAPLLIPRNAQDNIYGAPLLNRERIATASMLRPSMSEQRSIASFLDRETERIDALVAKKERLIELLQEQRTALITRAVTKGLDPTVATKDSGIEWLRDIPADWDAIPLKRVVDPSRPITYGIVQCGPDYPNGVRYIRPVDMTDEGGVQCDDLQRTTPEIAAAYGRSTVRPGDIVISIGPSFGKVMIVPSELDGANLTQGTARVAPGRDVHARFLFWALRSESSRMAWDSFCSGATFRALTLEILEACEVPLPALAEQRAIAAFLDRATAQIDGLVAKVREAIERLREHRTALISAAVTGKIDVREEVA